MTNLLIIQQIKKFTMQIKNKHKKINILSIRLNAGYSCCMTGAVPFQLNFDQISMNDCLQLFRSVTLTSSGRLLKRGRTALPNPLLETIVSPSFSKIPPA